MAAAADGGAPDRAVPSAGVSGTPRVDRALARREMSGVRVCPAPGREDCPADHEGAREGERR